MKRLLSVILVLAMCLALCACGGGESTPTTEPTTATTEPTQPSIDSIMKNAVLQYPASNENFKYNVYDTYVEITEYIGDPAAQQVTVPGTLEELPVYKVDFDVFDKCKVPNIVFEEGIYRINSGFSGDVVNVTLPSTLSSVSAGMFENCYKLESVTIPEGVGGIEFDAFKHCGKLKEVTVPSTVKFLSDDAFAFCDELTTVNLPEGLMQIEDGAFCYCKALKTITIPSTVTKLGEGVFRGSGLESIELPETVQEVGCGLFTACESLVLVKVHNAQMKINPMEGYTVAILFSQHNPDLVVHGKPASTIAQACATEDVFFEVMK